MATYQELRARSQQVRDEQNIGGNTALRVGQLLMDIVKYFNDNDAAASEYLQQHFAMVNDGTHLLNWQQSPIVILHTMGETYDEGDFSSLSQGENYYRNGFIVEANGQGGGINGETPKVNVLYVNLANDTLYTWNGASFDAITSGGGGGSISGDDIIKNAYYSNGNLVLIIETESGDKTVTIPVNFDASNYVPTSRTVNGKRLNNNIVIGMADIPGLLQAIANAGSGAVSVTTNQDGTFVIHVGETDYTINLNHTHEGMAKLVKCTEATLPQTLEDDTIYVQVDNLTTPTEIEALHIFGLEFTGGGGGGTPGLPAVQSPSDGSTINLGENQGSGVSQNIIVRAKNLNYGGSTDGLTIEAVGTGLTLSYGQQTGQSSITIPQNNGAVNTEVGVAFSGSGSFNGELRFKQGSTVLAVVVVVVVVALPDGFINDKAWNQSGNTVSIVDASGYCVSKQYEVDDSHTFEVNFGFANSGGTQYGCAVSNRSNMLSSGSAGTCFWANNAVRTFRPSTSEKYLSCTFLKSELNNCYIKDTTSNTYIWKGNNVT